ncbi:class I SAM-dependent methyltransferase [Nocardioides conyzicola]|uniref:Class I SAM-dependent methyltransferase n=1 Tax=Nocardioides conyzicola TaxID=1651781 RepID=A0ABP8XGC5_9ACTN
MSNADDVQAQYARRKDAVPADRYAVTNNDVFWGIQENDAVTRTMLIEAGFRPFTELRVLEVGCGTGDNLLRFLRWGFLPENLVGNELLADRVESARARLPAALAIHAGDAARLSFEQPFDIVYQSTVFSSVLDADAQQALARQMWSLVRPGGAVLSYDFSFDNPANPDVRKVTLSRLKELFPDGELRSRRTTLAPPIARRVSRHPLVFRALRAVPLLRTHRIVLISKPG